MQKKGGSFQVKHTSHRRKRLEHAVGESSLHIIARAPLAQQIGVRKTDVTERDPYSSEGSAFGLLRQGLRGFPEIGLSLARATPFADDTDR